MPGNEAPWVHTCEFTSVMSPCFSMAPTTTGELKRWLDAKGWSPETLAGHVPVSNMTWRRLLAKPADAPLPAKDRFLLASLEPGGSVPAGEGLDPVDVVLSGIRQTRAEVLTGMSAEGAAVAVPRRLLTESWKRVGSGPLPRRLVALVKDLRQHYGVVGKAGQVLILGGSPIS
jgi:hypothetical protein